MVLSVDRVYASCDAFYFAYIGMHIIVVVSKGLSVNSSPLSSYLNKQVVDVN